MVTSEINVSMLRHRMGNSKSANYDSFVTTDAIVAPSLAKPGTIQLPLRPTTLRQAAELNVNHCGV